MTLEPTDIPPAEKTIDAVHDPRLQFHTDTTARVTGESSDKPLTRLNTLITRTCTRIIKLFLFLILLSVASLKLDLKLDQSEMF